MYNFHGHLIRDIILDYIIVTKHNIKHPQSEFSTWCTQYSKYKILKIHVAFIKSAYGLKIEVNDYVKVLDCYSGVDLVHIHAENHYKDIQHNKPKLLTMLIWHI